MSRRNTTDLCGVLVIDKPAGITSHDVVAKVRRICGERRVGHAGTLDPMATGLLVVLIGPATRFVQYLTAANKSYDARITFGTETDTDDAEGKVLAASPVPASLTYPHVAERYISDIPGRYEQLPPRYSAVKKNGVAAYVIARRGKAPDLSPRLVTIFEARLLAIDPGPPLCWDVAFTVSKGTYIRAIARDIGRSLGTCAHLGALRRTAFGGLSLANAITLDALPVERSAFVEALIDPIDVLNMPVVHVDAKIASLIAVGRALPAHTVGTATLPDGPYIMVHDKRVLGIYEKAEERMKPSVVMPPGTLLETAR